MECVYGLDLSYSINKKSYNLIEASAFDEFCMKSEGIAKGVASVTRLVSFGDDRYGLVHRPSTGDSKELISGFVFEKGEYSKLSDSVKEALSKIKNYSSSSSKLILCNTPSSQQIVLFDNSLSQFKTIDLFDKREREQIKKENNYTKFKGSGSDDGDQKEEDTKVNGRGDDDGDGDADGDAEAVDEKEKESSKEKEKTDGDKKKKSERDKEKERKRRQKAGGGAASAPKFKVKSSIKKVFKHLLLTTNGSLYGLQKSFHKKYVNNNRIMDVKCDGSRCTLCLDENGVLWSFGINLFGKLGLKRNDKKAEYTNPREIAIFKAYKVSDFGITNKCCIACCANGSVYGWGSYSKSSLGTDSDIWYTPKLISSTSDANTALEETQKSRWKVFAGFRFVILLNETTNKLYVANTEFGWTVLEKAKNGFIVQTQEVVLPKNVVIVDVVPSSESAMIVAKTSDST